MIPKSSMIQREFQLKVWTSIIQKPTAIPPSSMALLTLLRSHYNDPDVDDNEEGSSFRMNQ